MTRKVFRPGGLLWSYACCLVHVRDPLRTSGPGAAIRDDRGKCGMSGCGSWPQRGTIPST